MQKFLIRDNVKSLSYWTSCVDLTTISYEELINLVSSSRLKGPSEIICCFTDHNPFLALHSCRLKSLSPFFLRKDMTQEFPVEKRFKKDLESSLSTNDETSRPQRAGELHRQLQNRHVAMISIGGAIGTGLFVGTATALSHGGALGLVLGYTLMGFLGWMLMCSLGEMIAHLPIVGGHLALAERFFSSSLSFALGWSYWYMWSIICPTELSASALLMTYWSSKVNLAVYIAVFWVFVGAINLGGVRVYGEMEFWFSSIKVIAVVIVLILGIILDLGGVTGDRIGFRYWKNPGPLPQYDGVPGALGRFCAVFSVLITASFSYIGVELPAIAAAEAKNPKRNLPKAIKRVAGRVLGFYVAGTFIVSLLVPANEPRLSLKTETGAKSPFVIAMQNAGIKGLPSVLNASLVTFTLSAASSNIYISSRCLYGLSVAGNAPRILSKTTRNGLPIYSYFVAMALATLGFVAASKGKSGAAFGYFSNMTSVAGLLNWWGIFLTYIRFYNGAQAQGFDRSKLPYQSPFGGVGAWFGVAACSIIIIFNGFEVFLPGQWKLEKFLTCYLPIPSFALMFLAHKWWTGARMVDEQAMDFVTGSQDAVEEEEIPPTSIIGKIWSILM
ncbi:hypothetical protein O181_026838 [Austropuccinia psidii MF-1]|uniref:Amino acid permease/ SLC12A domain-containing protein n=1 Tax=Austropuccinia psidii MF-1 TaxID=1389203 RepID=A0A9Q3CQL2_9BASI|nr:hypothetical protein [Austropuccinia psidii MF-1]